VVAGIATSRGPKSDKRDAYGLAEKLRVGNLDKHVFKAPRQFTRLRELYRTHTTLVRDLVRAQARIKSVYRSRGVLVAGLDVYSSRRRDSSIEELPSSAVSRMLSRVAALRAWGLRPGLRGVFSCAGESLILPGAPRPWRARPVPCLA
jgi:hypothetical protein